MKRIALIASFGLIGPMLPHIAAAQDAPAASATAPIVVTGQRPSPAEARRRAQAFVARTGVALGHTPAARWVDPVCPRAMGIAPPHSATVEETVRAIATAAGVPVAGTDCTPNIAIMLSQDAAATVRRIEERQPWRLREARAAGQESLLNESAPIRWWYVTGERASDGTSANQPGMVGALENGQGGSNLPSSATSGSTRQYNSSMISTRAIRAIQSATVVIDLRRTEGRPLEAVAAYAALVALAEIRFEGTAPDGSILSLFGSDYAERGLSDLDQAFLRGLYRMPLDRMGRVHRARLTGAMTDAQLGQSRN